MNQIAAEELTASEIAQRLGASETGVKKAIDEMDITGRRSWSDRRKIVYPDGTLERVREWLESHS